MLSPGARPPPVLLVRRLFLLGVSWRLIAWGTPMSPLSSMRWQVSTRICSGMRVSLAGDGALQATVDARTHQCVERNEDDAVGNEEGRMGFTTCAGKVGAVVGRRDAVAIAKPCHRRNRQAHVDDEEAVQEHAHRPVPAKDGHGSLHKDKVDADEGNDADDVDECGILRARQPRRRHKDKRDGEKEGGKEARHKVGHPIRALCRLQPALAAGQTPVVLQVAQQLQRHDAQAKGEHEHGGLETRRILVGYVVEDDVAIAKWVVGVLHGGTTRGEGENGAEWGECGRAPTAATFVSLPLLAFAAPIPHHRLFGGSFLPPVLTTVSRAPLRYSKTHTNPN